MNHKLLNDSFLILIIASLVLSGCASTRSQPAPVIDRTELPSETHSSETRTGSSTTENNQNTAKKTVGKNQYEVVKGDTLYSIGKKLGIPHQSIAEENHIENNAIYVGQVLNLPGTNSQKNNTDNSNVVTQPLKKDDAPQAVAQKPTMVNGVPHYDYPKATRDIAGADSKAITTTTTTSNASQKSSQSESKPDTSKVAEKASNTPNNVSNNTGNIDIDTLQDQNIEWRWPAKGKVIAEYDKQTNKGIDIGGSVGQPILAAGTGKVIYSGTDIRGYGKLVIIKHNRNFLSVYAHQGNIFVKEGQFVNLHDKIAEMGRDSSSTTKLHFEIRKKGKTVDPKEYLPS